MQTLAAMPHLLLAMLRTCVCVSESQMTIQFTAAAS